jgi:hypothetical protein
LQAKLKGKSEAVAAKVEGEDESSLTVRDKVTSEDIAVV